MDYTKEKHWVLLFLTNAKPNSLTIKNKNCSVLVTEENFI
jgi:hypothetical protein